MPKYIIELPIECCTGSVLMEVEAENFEEARSRIEEDTSNGKEVGLRMADIEVGEEVEDGYEASKLQEEIDGSPDSLYLLKGE